MFELTNFEPMVQETYMIILNCIQKSHIYIFDEDSSLSFLSYLKLIVNILAALSHTGGVLDRVHQGADLVQLTSDLSTTLNFWMTILLFIQLYVNRKSIKHLIMNLGMQWRTDEQLRPEMIAVKHKSVKSFYTLISGFYKFLTIFGLVYLSPRLIYVTFKHLILKQEVTFKTTLQVKVPFPFEDNFVIYCLVYLIDSKLTMDVAYIVTFDLLLLSTTIHHLRLMFLMLQDDLNSIQDVDQATAERRLKNFIPHHADILKLLAQISEAFGSIFIIHLAFFCGTMCFYCFAVRVHCSLENLQNLMACTFLLICLYACCSIGQHLTDESLRIADAAYNSQWYFMSSEYRRCLIFIMLRSQKAQYIKSTSFTDVSLQSFTKILNATWSFLSVVTTMYEA